MIMFLPIFLGVFSAGIALMLVYWSVVSGAWVYLIGVPVAGYFSFKFFKGIKEIASESSMSEVMEFFGALLKPFFYACVLMGIVVLVIMMFE